MKLTMVVLCMLFLFFSAGCSKESDQTGKVVAASADDEQQVINSAVAFLSIKYGKTAVQPQAMVVKNADELKERQKAIFGEAENGMVLVVWPDLLVIFDPETQKVVKELEINSFEV